MRGSIAVLASALALGLLTAAAALVLGSLFWIAIRRRAKASRRRAVARAKAGEPGAGASPSVEPTPTPDASEDRDGVVPDIDEDALLELHPRPRHADGRVGGLKRDASSRSEGASRRARKDSRRTTG